MATTKASVRPTENEPPTYYTIKLKRVVTLHDEIYRPGVDIVCDEATLADFGDNVLEKRPRDTEDFYLRKAR